MVGMDIGGTRLRAALVDRHGAVQDRREGATPAGDATGLVPALVALARELGPGLPVGIGIAGLVGRDGTVRYGPNIAVRDLPLARRSSAELDVPVVVVNDASAATVAEQRLGAACGHDDVVMLTLGTGVGGGIVADGRLVVGSGLAGELGHVVVEMDGRRCPCGARGCLEAYVAGPAIVARAREGLAAGRRSVLEAHADLRGEQVSAAAADGDPFASSVLDATGRWLAVAVVSLVNALDPTVVVLGGGAAAPLARWLVPPVEQALASSIIGAGWRTPPTVELAGLGDDAGLVGAALLAGDAARRLPAGAQALPSDDDQPGAHGHG